MFYYQNEEISMIAELVDDECRLTKYDGKNIPLVGITDIETFYSHLSDRTMPVLFDDEYTPAESSFALSATMFHHGLRSIVEEKNIWIKLPSTERTQQK